MEKPKSLIVLKGQMGSYATLLTVDELHDKLVNQTGDFITIDVIGVGSVIFNAKEISMFFPYIEAPVKEEKKEEKKGPFLTPKGKC